MDGMGMIANAQFVLTFKVCFLPSIGQFLMSIFYTLYVVLSFIIEYCVAFCFSYAWLSCKLIIFNSVQL